MADDNCSSKQTFCNNCQIVGEYSEIKFKFTSTFKPKQKVDGKWKDEVITGLTKISNYGSGTKVPSKKDIDNLEQIITKNKIYASDFNEIITLLKSDSSVNKKERLMGSYFAELEEAINNYKLSSDNCNTCNSGCNTTCEASSQYCGSGCEVSCQPCQTNCEGGICACQGCDSCMCQVGKEDEAG